MTENGEPKAQVSLSPAQQRAKAVKYLVNMGVGAVLCALACLLYFGFHKYEALAPALAGIAFMAIAGVALYEDRSLLHEFYASHLWLLRASLALGGLGAIFFGGGMLAFGLVAFAEIIRGAPGTPSGGLLACGLIGTVVGPVVFAFAKDMCLSAFRSDVALLEWTRKSELVSPGTLERS